MSIFFPSLICGIILNQQPKILMAIDSIKKIESPLSLHYKLFGGAHVLDIAMTSSQTSGPATSKQGLIQHLKETCKELDGFVKTSTSRKIKLELLLKFLMEEEAKEVGHDDDAAKNVDPASGESGNNARSGNVDSDGDDEPSNDGESDGGDESGSKVESRNDESGGGDNDGDNIDGAKDPTGEQKKA